MSAFTDYRDSYYVYKRNGKEYTIPSGLLNSLFKTYGYCVDPAVKNGLSLSPTDIDQLTNLASTHNDYALLNTIKLVSRGKAPSPRMINDNIMYEVTLNEKSRFNHSNYDKQTNIADVLKIILHIGLYMAGWRGNDEPYIVTSRPVYDIVRVELKIAPLIQSLYSNMNYALIKNFHIMAYYRGNSLKPSVVDNSLNIDQCLNRVSLGMNQDYKQLSSYLIFTAYYYTTVVCNIPLPMLEPLISSLSHDITSVLK